VPDPVCVKPPARLRLAEDPKVNASLFATDILPTVVVIGPLIAKPVPFKLIPEELFVLMVPLSVVVPLPAN
jgi:hypothetical protein